MSFCLTERWSSQLACLGDSFERNWTAKVCSYDTSLPTGEALFGYRQLGEIQDMSRN